MEGPFRNIFLKEGFGNAAVVPLSTGICLLLKYYIILSALVCNTTILLSNLVLSKVIIVIEGGDYF